MGAGLPRFPLVLPTALAQGSLDPNNKFPMLYKLDLSFLFSLHCNVQNCCSKDGTQGLCMS